MTYSMFKKTKTKIAFKHFVIIKNYISSTLCFVASN